MTDAAHILDVEEEGADVVHLATTVDPLLAQWARFRDLFAEGMGDGFWTIEDLEQKVAHRRAFFFPGRNAAIVGQVEVYPTGRKVFQSLWAVGEVEEIVAMVPGVEAIARMMGCDAMLIEGRSAWKKLLGPQGYSPWSVTLCKEL